MVGGNGGGGRSEKKGGADGTTDNGTNKRFPLTYTLLVNYLCELDRLELAVICHVQSQLSKTKRTP